MDDIASDLALSEAYRQMTKLGTLPKVRQNNDRIICEYFDKKMGLVHEGDNPGLLGKVDGLWCRTNSLCGCVSVSLQLSWLELEKAERPLYS